MAVKITIPVEFQDSAQSYKQVIAQLQSQLKKVKPGTAIYDNIKEQLKKAQKLGESLDLSFDKGISSSSDIDKITKTFSSLQRILTEVSNTYKGLSFEQLNIIPENFGDQAKEFTRVTNELLKAEKRLSEKKGSTVSSLVDGIERQSFGDDLLDRDAITVLKELEGAMAGVEQSAEEARKKVSDLEAELAELPKRREELSKQFNSNTDATYDAIANRKKASDEAKKVLGNLSADIFGDGSETNRAILEGWLISLGLDEGSVKQLLSQAELKIEEIKKFIKDNFDNNALVKAKENYSKQKKAKTAFEQLSSETDKQNEIEIAKQNLDQKEKDVARLKEQTKILKGYNLEDEVKKIDSEIDSLKSELEQLRSQILAQGQSGAPEVKDTPNDKGARNALDQVNQAKQFQDHLKQATGHWLSTQMIITKVREGLHQAWVDIQGLDKAMTNIAVVTDMSVSDLWGKIDEYMAIAQDYGVTTQGVYEVSQLYYQQGLSTNEVMAATTETLKMARIAGMDYAEAADAMTVAIRAFKMEMSDAQIITDVYSKVAAVTASDSQELAIAMSKTASSAESVGSSFENTTAMLAVMIETTRESAQNLGSALKSIISRYGEMKSGLTVDSDGEAIDYNKVDTALQSVGISIKDAQGQFRDFDDVIFELSKKWDSLDKNTQRYIATIMAGNRQQSRFIALVDNWERLEEVSSAAYDSEDAGLLQYAKTLDSLETKLNALSTSFQQFYMNIVNGGFFKGVVDTITYLLNGLNKIGSWTSILNIASLITSIKTITSSLSTGVLTPISQLVASCKSRFEEITTIAYKSGREARESYQQGWKSADVPLTINTGSTSGTTSGTKRRHAQAQTQTSATNSTSEVTSGLMGTIGSWISKNSGKAITIGSLIGSALNVGGAAVANKNATGGALMSMLGSTISNGVSGAAMGGPWGAVAGIALGVISNMSSVVEAHANRLNEKLEKANEELKDAELDRATKKEEARTLASALDNLKKLQSARHASEEAEQAYIEASNSVAEQFPQLISSYDDAGNAIVDVINNSTDAEWLLIRARNQAAEAAETAAAAELKAAMAQQKATDKEIKDYAGSGISGMGGGKKNWITDILVQNLTSEEDWLMDWETGEESLIDETLASLFAKYEEGDNTLQGGANLLVSDLQSGVLDPYLEKFNLTQEDFLNVIKDYINNNNLYKNNGFGGKKIESVLDLIGDYNLLTAEDRVNDARIEAAREAVGRNKINSLLTSTDPLEEADWRQISGAEELFKEQILKKTKLTEHDFDENGKLTDAAQTRIDVLFSETYESYEALYEQIEYDLEDFNDYLKSANKGAYTYKEVREQMHQMFGENLPEPIKVWLDSLNEEINGSVENLGEGLYNNEEFPWSEIYGNISQLKIVLRQIPKQYSDEIYDFAEKIGTSVKDETLTNGQAEDLVTKYMSMWTALDDESLGLSTEQLGEAREALAGADLFNISGIEALTRTLTDLGIDVSLLGLNDFPVYAVNYVTEYANLVERVENGLTQMTDWLDKVGKGLNTEDASKLASRMGTNLNDKDMFTFEDGNWYVNDISAVVANIEKEYANYSQELTECLEADLEILQTPLDEASREQRTARTQLLNSNLENAKKWAEEQSAKDSNWTAPPSDVGLVEAYLKANYEGILDAYEQEKEWLTSEAERSLEIGKRARELSGGELQKRQRESYDLIKGKGLLGYSAEEAAQLEKDLGLTLQANAEGTFDLDESNIAKLPKDVQNAIYQWMDDEAQSAGNAIKDLGSTFASGKSYGQYAKVFKTKQEELGYKEADAYMQGLITRALNNEQEAIDELWQEVAQEITGDKLNVDDPRVKEAVDGLLDSCKDGNTENTLKFLELSKKQIEGTLTASEITELNNLNVDGQWAQDLTNILARTDLDILQKNGELVKAALKSGAEWSKIEDTVSSGYSDILKLYQAQAQGLNTDDVSALDAAQGIIGDAGFYSNEALTKMLTQAAEEGYDFKYESFNEVFRWDEITDSWVRRAGSELSTLFGQEVPYWMEQAFSKSENQKAVSEAIRIEDAGKTITESVGQLYTNAANASLDDLKGLFETVHGEGSFADSGMLDSYQNAIKQAKKGNVSILQDFLIDLVEQAREKGIDVDITALQDSINDLALSIVASIAETFEAGISGGMSNTDYTQLLKNIGVNQFNENGSLSKDWEHWQSLVIHTNEGLKFTESGLTEVYHTLRSFNATASQGILEMIADDLTQYESLSSTVKYIHELREKIQKTDERDEDKIKQYEDELELAEKILRIRSQDPDQFKFMERAIPDEIQSPLNVWQNAADAASALQDAKTNGYMGAEDFYRIVTTASEYMTAAGQKFEVAGMDYETLIKKATSSLATANGNLVIDFSKFGANFAGGIDDMAGGLEDGLKELARQQIEMLDGMIAMLETMKTIQDIGNDIDKDADGLFDFRELFNFNEISGVVTLKEDTVKWWNEFQSVFGIMIFDGLQLDDAWKQGVIKATEIAKFMNDAQSIIDNATSDIEGMIDQIVAAAQTAFGTDVAVKIGLDLEKQFEFHDDGQVTYNGVKYPNEAAAMAAWKTTVSNSTDGLLNQESPITLDDGTTITYKRVANTDIIYEVHTNKDGKEKYVLNNETYTTPEALNDKLKTLAPQPQEMKGDTTQGEYLAAGEYAGVEYKVGPLVQVNGDPVENGLIGWIKENFEKAIESTEEGADSGEKWFFGGKYSGVEYKFGASVRVGGNTYTGGIGEFITKAIGAAIESTSEYAKVNMNLTATADTKEATDNLEKVISKLSEVDKNKEKQIKITASTSGAYNQLTSILNLINGIKSKTVTIHTSYTSSGIPPSNGGGGNTNPAEITPGINQAKGNVALAKGTLMGELGPELYVQNGSYHIAGSNGPEFVDLADDAIVFNHLQTQRILNTGHSFGRGTPVTNERRAVAWATGNVTGPALAGGIDSAIEQLKTAREFWKGLLNQLSLSELMSGSGGHKGGGSGNSIKAVTEELQEWYNLSRQIADIEQDINNLLAERENIEWSNGEEYLKSLREQQKLLQQQMATQQALLDYQELQLKRQAEHINQNRIWSQFLTVGADGLLQYIEGNETNGGKGALQVLQELNQMSGEQQTAYLKSIGYSYTNNDGEKLEGQELVEQFFQELQDQIDQYDSLYDTVHGTQETLEELQTSINDINDQIKENQMELEEEIFDIIVEALEKEIEVLEEQADLIEEANEAYINGLNEALSAERQMYDDNQKVADREQLQRQLSLLRRSGGSASEIANLEEQLNDMLKDEYFTNQERMIEEIQKANDLQVQQLQTQIKLQEDSLEYQKEHGVIWTQVYQVLAQSKDEILAFMQGQKPEFFSQSLLQQEAMLTEWAHKIGIYSEDRKYQNFAEHARNNLWDNGQAWNLGDMSKYQSTYNTLIDEEKNTIKDQFTSVYAQARLDGKDHTTAANEAAAAVSQTLKRKQDANNSQNNQAPTTNPNPQNPGGSSGDDSGSSSGSSSSGGSSSSDSPTHWQFYYNGTRRRCFTTKAKAEAAIEEMYNNEIAGLKVPQTKDYPNDAALQKAIEEYNKKKNAAVSHKTSAKGSLASGTHANGYSEGGIVDYTGIAVVHGTPGKPESFLNAEQTAQIREGLKESGKGGALEGIKAALLKLDSSIKAVTNINNKSESNSYTIAPGAVVIQVEQLNDAYDVDTLSADIMNRMYAIGNKSTNRGVSRR